MDTMALTCPITLDSIEVENVFYHKNIAFDVFALYTYLVKAVHYVNPVNRMEFTLEELESLEEKIKHLCGDDAIDYQTVDDQEDTLSVETEYESDVPDMENIVMQLQVLPQLHDECLKLEVNLSVPPSTPCSSVGEPEEDGDISSLDDVDDTIDIDLPPRRLYPSVVQLFQDTQRAKKIKNDLDMIQYLCYDSLDVITQIITLLSDDQFHQMVWEQTSPTVIETISRIVGECDDPGRDIDVEVTYTDCWEAYRTRLLRVLYRRYGDIIRDIRYIDTTEADLCVRSHIKNIAGNASIRDERKDILMKVLNDLL